MIEDQLSYGYFKRWATNFIKAFAADIISTIEAAFTDSQFDIEDQDNNQAAMLQSKFIDASNAVTTVANVPAFYCAYNKPGSLAPITINPGCYIKSITISGPPGATLVSTSHGSFCAVGVSSILGISNTSPGIYNAACISRTQHIDGIIDDLANETLSIGGSTTPTEDYQILIVYLQPANVAQRMVQ